MKLRAMLAILALGVALGGCEATRQAIGLGKNPPDEFQVVSHPPLSMPPDMTLPPPDPGAPRPQEGTAETQAETAVLANSTNVSVQPLTDTAAPSPSEEAFLQSAGATGPATNPKIRAEVDQEAVAEAAASQTLLDKLTFWRTPEPPGTIVDPVAEQQRLQQNAALGQPVTTGATPVIVRRKKALFEGIF
jgi:hypothetical protein